MICPKEVPVSPTCETAEGPFRISAETYIQRLQTQFGLTNSPFLGSGGLERVARDIAAAQTDLKNGDLSAEESTRLQEHIASLQNTELSLLRVKRVADHLDGENLPIDSAYNELFAKYTAPFNTETGHPALKKVFVDPTDGMVFANLGKMCP